jgi:uncharacterized RmlC-like cupin family protein
MKTTLTAAANHLPSARHTHVRPETSGATEIPARALCAGRMHIPGGKTTAPQRHHTTEATLAVISGYAAVLSGPTMTPALPNPGETIHIPPGMPYAVVNLSLNVSVLLLSFRTDPGFTTDVHRAPDMDSAASVRIVPLRIGYYQRLMHQRTGHITSSR